METVYPHEYKLVLSTGEELLVAEFDPEVVPGLRSEAVRAASEDVLSRCTRAPRDVLEEAKRGHDARLKPLLRTPPVGALLKVASTLCSERASCSMYDRTKCAARNVFRAGGAFPECWEYQLPPVPPGGASRDAGTEFMARGICTAIVHAWRQGMYAVLVE